MTIRGFLESAMLNKTIYDLINKFYEKCLNKEYNDNNYYLNEFNDQLK